MGHSLLPSPSTCCRPHAKPYRRQGLAPCRRPQRRPLVPLHGTIPREAPSAYDVDTLPAKPGAAANGNGSSAPAMVPAGAPGASSGLAKQDFAKFVQFFRQASPYVEGHRGKTFVIVVPGSVSWAGWVGDMFMNYTVQEVRGGM
jgi:hypothetical protein